MCYNKFGDNMKVRVVGSGNLWTARNSASYVIDNKIVVDFPNGMCKDLLKQGIDPGTIDNVLITHFHADHYFDIPFYFLLKSNASYKHIYMACGKEGKKKNLNLLKMAFPNSFKEIMNDISIKYEYRNNFTIDDYIISKILVDHGRMKPSYGYVINKGDVKAGFTGDTTICRNVEVMASVCDYLFCDCTLIEGTDKHMGIDMIQELVKKYTNCIFVVSHLSESTRKELLKLNIKNVIVPDDGTVIDIKATK